MQARSDVATAVARATKSISKMDYLIFYLRIEAGVSVTDIAEIVGFSQDRISSRLKGVYDRIKQEIEDSTEY